MKSYSLRDARRLAIGTSDWRQAMWNKWLVGYLTPRQDEVETFSGTTAACTSSSLDGASTARTSDWNAVAPPLGRTSETLRPPAPSLNVDEPSVARPKDDEPSPSRRTAMEVETWADEQDEPNVHSRRARNALTLRARLQHITDQLDSLDLAFERQSERENLVRVQQRVQDRALSDILDRLVEAQDRQTQGIVSCSRALERLERRLVASERGSRVTGHSIYPAADGDEGAINTGGATDSLVPPSMTQRIQPPFGVANARDVVAPLSGQLSEISLPTLLSMAELECWTGRLVVEAGHRTVLLDLLGGLLVGVFEDDSPSDAVEALYELVEVRVGRFSFSPRPHVAKTELAPMTVGTLLLRASHRRDEMSRADAATNS